MRNLILLAGTAALALAAPASAEKGGKGGGHGQGGGKPAKVEGGGHGGGHAAKPAKSERHSARAEKPQRAAREQRHAIRDERRHDAFDRRSGEEHRDFRRVGRDVHPVAGFHPDRPRFAGYDRFCPPGLAKKGNGCLPPGQAKKLFARGQRIDRRLFEGYRVPLAYRGFYQDT
ncbi:MAG TPA: hypothetical protein VEW26_02430, partial [Allosphingosinicella sp.]|nr:hypothetical protein [Allosphingosinicella sp.]